MLADVSAVPAEFVGIKVSEAPEAPDNDESVASKTLIKPSAVVVTVETYLLDPPVVVCSQPQPFAPGGDDELPVW